MRDDRGEAAFRGLAVGGSGARRCAEGVVGERVSRRARVVRRLAGGALQVLVHGANLVARVAEERERHLLRLVGHLDNRKQH